MAADARGDAGAAAAVSEDARASVKKKFQWTPYSSAASWYEAARTASSLPKPSATRGAWRSSERRSRAAGEAVASVRRSLRPPRCSGATVAAGGEPPVFPASPCSALCAATRRGSTPERMTAPTPRSMTL
eukprot:6262531-Prymnesium_polylepis.1